STKHLRRDEGRGRRSVRAVPPQRQTAVPHPENIALFPRRGRNPATHLAYDDGNAKANEFLYRRVDLEDVVDAHLLAIERAPLIGFGRYIISATTPFHPDDLLDLRVNAPEVVKRRVPEYEEEYTRRGWRMFPSVDRVYVNERARRELAW